MEMEAEFAAAGERIIDAARMTKTLAAQAPPFRAGDKPPVAWDYTARYGIIHSWPGSSSPTATWCTPASTMSSGALSTGGGS